MTSSLLGINKKEIVMETLLVSSIEKLKFNSSSKIVGLELYNPFEEFANCSKCDKELTSSKLEWVQIKGKIVCDTCYHREMILEKLGNESRKNRRYRKHVRYTQNKMPSMPKMV